MSSLYWIQGSFSRSNMRQTIVALYLNSHSHFPACSVSVEVKALAANLAQNSGKHFSVSNQLTHISVIIKMLTIKLSVLLWNISLSVLLEYLYIYLTIFCNKTLNSRLHILEALIYYLRNSLQAVASILRQAASLFLISLEKKIVYSPCRCP